MNGDEFSILKPELFEEVRALIHISSMASFEQARCLFHNQYGRCLIAIALMNSITYTKAGTCGQRFMTFPITANSSINLSN